MGKTFLAEKVYESLLGDFPVILIEPSTTKQILVEIAEAVGIGSKSLEGKMLSADALKVAIADYLAQNIAILIFDNAHLLEPKFRVWLKKLKTLGTPLLLTATEPPRTDIFINLPRIELKPLPNYAIRELMEQTCLEQGIELKPRDFARMLERTGGNPLLAIRSVEEELLGVEMEVSDTKGLYFDITPLIALVFVVFASCRFIALGTNNQNLYVLTGIGGAVSLGIFQAVRSLPRESRRIET